MVLCQMPIGIMYCPELICSRKVLLDEIYKNWVNLDTKPALQ
jgi:hypothetical protein